MPTIHVMFQANEEAGVPEHSVSFIESLWADDGFGFNCYLGAPVMFVVNHFIPQRLPTKYPREIDESEYGVH